MKTLAYTSMCFTLLAMMLLEMAIVIDLLVAMNGEIPLTDIVQNIKQPGISHLMIMIIIWFLTGLLFKATFVAWRKDS